MIECSNLSHARILVVVGLVAGAGADGPAQTLDMTELCNFRVDHIAWVDVSVGGDTIFFATEGHADKAPILYWAAAPDYRKLKSRTIEAAIVRHAVSSDGRFIALVLSNGVLRVVDTREGAFGTVCDVALSDLVTTDCVDGDALHDVRVRFIDDKLLIIKFQGITKPGLATIISAEKPGDVLEQRLVEGLALEIGGTRARLLMAGSRSIYAEDWSGRVIYHVEAVWPIFFESAQTRGWFCSMVPRLGSERVWFVGVWELETGNVLGRLSLDGQSLAARPVFSRCGRYLYVLRCDGVMIRWDYLQNKQSDCKVFQDELSGLMDGQTALAARERCLVVVTSTRDKVRVCLLPHYADHGLREVSTSKRHSSLRKCYRRTKQWRNRRCLRLKRNHKGTWRH